jgi:hypothetical protein
MLCISPDLSHTIKNERFASIATVILSTFTSANADDPNALVVVDLLEKWHFSMGRRDRNHLQGGNERAYKCKTS